MAVIRLGEHHDPPAPRRVRLGPAAMLALQQRIGRDHGISLPPGLGISPTPGVTTDDQAPELAQAAELLDSGALAGDGAAEAVAANLASLVTSPRRIRVSVAGPATRRLGWFWVGPRLAGSLVRREDAHELALFDARQWGVELLAVLPPAEHEEAGRQPFSVPVDALGALAGTSGEAAAVEGLAAVWDLPSGVGRRVQEWADGVRAVLHLSVHAGPDLPPRVLVWFLDRHGWWSGEPFPTDGGPRRVTVAPARRRDLPSHLGALVTEAWW